METANTEKKGINKNLIIIIAAVVVAIIALIVGGIFIFGEKTYRVLKIYEVEGQASVVHSDGSEVTPYENMLLQSGDQISLVEGKLIIKADEDKFIYLENNTKIILEADGTAANSRTSIQLLEGAVINHIEEPLSDKSVYELNTQNATMSVRGTVFRAEYTVSANGVAYTDEQTFGGLVDTTPVLEDGSKGLTRSVGKGKQVQIYRDADVTDFTGEEEDIDYQRLKLQTLDYLGVISEETDKELSVSSNEIEGLKADNPGPFTVTFYNGKTVFGTVEVQKGDLVQEPLLMPTESGKWAFDFKNTPITENTDIIWEDGK